MDWYIVIKTIKGRRYRYRQKTWREGRHVRTRSEYIGPTGGEVGHPDLDGATTLPLPLSADVPKIFDASIIEQTIRELAEGKRHDRWGSGWSAEAPSGPSLVQRNVPIEKVLELLPIKRASSSCGAFYNPLTDVLNVPPKNHFTGIAGESATEVYYSTLLHELIHWTMAKWRLGRYDGSLFRDRKRYAREELVAELGAMMLMRHFQIYPSHPEMHTTYFQDWLKRAGDRDSALAHARAEAERAVRYILERGIISS